MSRFKKVVGLIAAVSMMASLFAGCGGKGENQTGTTSAETAKVAESTEPVKVTWVNWGAAEDATKGAFDEMVKGFETKNPNIKIEQVGYPYNQMKDQLLIMSAGGNPPDIAQTKAEWVAGLNNAGALQPLDELLDKSVLDDYYEGLLKGCKYDGKIMSAPWAPSPILMYYNKTLMQKAGISEPPKTWTEMIEQAKKISALGTDDKGNKIYGMGISMKKAPGTGYFFLLNMWQNGGEFLDDSGKVVINSQGNINAFTEARKIVKEKITPEGMEIKELRNLFAQGQMGFHFDMEAGVGIFEKGSPKGKEFAKEYGITGIPGAKDANGISFAVEHQLVIFKASKLQKEAANLVDFLSGPEGMKIYNDNNGNKLPSRKSVEALEFYKNQDKSFLQSFISALSTARALPSGNEAFLKACEEIADIVARAGLTDEEVTKMVEGLDKKVKELYKQ